MAKPLTSRAIEALKPHPKKRLEIADGALTGLYLVVQSSGSKSWAVRYRHDGKTTKLTLGPWPRLGLAEARESAQETLRHVSEGRNPAADRVTLAKLKRVTPPDDGRTFEAVLDRFIASQKAKGRRSADAQKALLDKDATKHWRRRRITSITAADVVERIEAMIERGAPVNAARFRATLSKFFSYAVKAQLCPDNPVRLTENPVDPKSRQRKRKLDDRELALVWQAAGKLGYPFGSAVRLLVLTGARRNEVCAAPRSEFDVERKAWVLPPERAKNSIEHLVPLSEAALAIISALPVIADSEFLFTTTGDAPISGFTKSMARLNATIAKLNNGEPIPHWTLHDLRRTFSSGWARLRVPTEVTEKALNHTSGSFGGVAGVYNVHEYEDERREAMEAWARYVLAVVDGKPTPRNVVPLRPAVA
jgi:integrase